VLHSREGCSTVTDEIVRIQYLPRTNRAHPGSNSLDYDLDARQCAFDFTLHPLNLGLEECLQVPKFGRESPSIEFEVKRTTEDMILSASTSIWVSGFEILFSIKLPVSASPSDESEFSAGAAEDKGGEFIGYSSKLI
jgi:hypothetical protein